MTQTQTTWPPEGSRPGPDLREATRQRLADPERHAYARPVGGSGCAICGCDRGWHTRAEGDEVEVGGIASLPPEVESALRAFVGGES